MKNMKRILILLLTVLLMTSFSVAAAAAEEPPEQDPAELLKELEAQRDQIQTMKTKAENLEKQNGELQEKLTEQSGAIERISSELAEVKQKQDAGQNTESIRLYLYVSIGVSVLSFLMAVIAVIAGARSSVGKELKILEGNIQNVASVHEKLQHQVGERLRLHEQRMDNLENRMR